jgi:hypothetical protein
MGCRQMLSLIARMNMNCRGMDNFELLNQLFEQKKSPENSRGLISNQIQFIL